MGEADVPAVLYASRRIVTVSLFYSLRDVPTLRFDVITACADAVNSTTFLGAAPGHVVFEGMRKRRRLLATGETNWDESMAFTWRTEPWNNVYNKATGTFDKIVNKITGLTPHHERDLNELLTA